MSGHGYTRWSALDSPGGQTGGNVSELESEFIPLGLPLRLADSQRRPAWSPGDGVRCGCGVIIGSFQIPCRRQKEDKSRKCVQILENEEQNSTNEQKYINRYQFDTQDFNFSVPLFHFHDPNRRRSRDLRAHRWESCGGLEMTVPVSTWHQTELWQQKWDASQPTWTPNLGM